MTGKGRGESLYLYFPRLPRDRLLDRKFSRLGDFFLHFIHAIRTSVTTASTIAANPTASAATTEESETHNEVVIINKTIGL